MLTDAIRIDRLIIDLIQSYRTPQLDTVFLLLSWSVVLAFFISVLYLTKKKHIQKAIILIAASAITYITVMAIKLGVGRWRPDMSEALSFPSMHATLAFLFAFYLPVKKKFKALLILWAVLIAFSRMWLNLHYFSDVLAGATFGIIIAYYLELKNLRKIIKKKFHLKTPKGKIKKKSAGKS